VGRRVVANGTYPASAQIQNDHRFQNVINLGLFERQADLSMIIDQTSSLDICDAIAVKNDASDWK
jgi:hypothetical protein